MEMKSMRVCPDCLGSGEVCFEPCQYCGGEGWFPRDIEDDDEGVSLEDAE